MQNRPRIGFSSPQALRFQVQFLTFKMLCLAVSITKLAKRDSLTTFTPTELVFAFSMLLLIKSLYSQHQQNYQAIPEPRLQADVPPQSARRFMMFQDEETLKQNMSQYGFNTFIAFVGLYSFLSNLLSGIENVDVSYAFIAGLLVNLGARDRAIAKKENFGATEVIYQAPPRPAQ